MTLKAFTPKVGDQFLNEEGRVFEIVDHLPDGEFRCKRDSTFASCVFVFERFHLNEIIPEKQGNFWILTIEAMEARLAKRSRTA